MPLASGSGQAAQRTHTQDMEQGAGRVFVRSGTQKSEKSPANGPSSPLHASRSFGFSGFSTGAGTWVVKSCLSLPAAAREVALRPCRPSHHRRDAAFQQRSDQSSEGRCRRASEKTRHGWWCRVGSDRPAAIMLNPNASSTNQC